MARMKVRYIGKGDAITCEYNGKKYTFSKSRPEQEIPLEVFRYMVSDSNPFRLDLLPVMVIEDKPVSPVPIPEPEPEIPSAPEPEKEPEVPSATEPEPPTEEAEPEPEKEIKKPKKKKKTKKKK